MRYALVGLGSMGMGMAKSMKRAGLDVCGVDMSENCTNEFVKFGGNAQSKLSTIANDCEIIIFVLVNSTQIKTVLSDSISSIRNGTIIISCSTVSPKFITELAAELRTKGIELIDAPISGGKAKADSGEITIMASGSKANLIKAEKFFGAVAKKVYNLGEKVGAGSKMKVVHQLLAGSHIVAAAEAMALGRKFELDPESIYDVVLNAAGYSWMFENRVPHIIENDFSPKSAVNIFVKDLDLVIESGQELGIGLPLANTALNQFIKAKNMGLGLEDDSAVYKTY